MTSQTADEKQKIQQELLDAFARDSAHKTCWKYFRESRRATHFDAEIIASLAASKILAERTKHEAELAKEREQSRILQKVNLRNAEVYEKNLNEASQKTAEVILLFLKGRIDSDEKEVLEEWIKQKYLGTKAEVQTKEG